MSVVAAGAAASRGRARRPATRAHRAAIGAYAALCVAVAALAAIPLRTGGLRLALVCGFFALWTGALFLFWDRILVRILCFTLAFGAGALIFLPLRPIDGDSLRSEYVRSLESYAGTPYVAGGETHLGMDPSGLVRVGLMEAEFREGIRSRNFVLLRKSASLWWNDCSAKDLAARFQGRTRVLADAPSLNDADYAALKPGDMAVVAGGQHILAYTGDHAWIEADPGRGKVVTVRTPSRDGWFVRPVRLLRWQIVEPAAPAVEPR